MKKLLVAAAMSALATAAVPAFISSAQAAPAKNPMCSLAAAQKNPMAWDEFYGCFGARPKFEPAMARAPSGTPAADFCRMAGQEKDVVGWSQFYQCWHHQ